MDTNSDGRFYKPTNREWKWIALLCFGVLFGALLWIRHLNAVPRAHISGMEANQPWIVIDPRIGARTTVPYMDKQNPNILYLVVVSTRGEAIRVDLTTKQSSTYWFDVKEWEQVDNLANHCLHCEPTDYYGFYSHHVNQFLTLYAEYRGEKETRTVRHMFGYPWANEPGLRTAELRSGVWYIGDMRDGHRNDMLRVKVKNAELTKWDLGDLYISPDERWAIFRLSNRNGRIFIFDRKATGPARSAEEFWMTPPLTSY